MSKTFMDEVREAETGAGNPDNWPDYWELCEKLIAIDDLIQKWWLDDNASNLLTVTAIARILEGDSSPITQQTIDKQE